MNTKENATIIPVPQEAYKLGDDRYLVEMSDRLHRLRALLKEKEKRKAKLSKRSFNKPVSTSIM